MTNEIKMKPGSRISDNPAIKAAVDWAGSQSRLAVRMEATRCQLSSWVAAGYLPANQAIRLERLSGGKFKAVDLFKHDDEVGEF